MTEKFEIREIAREVLQEEREHCPIGITNKSQLKEHERRLGDMERNVKDATDKVSKEVGRITWYIIAVLGAIVAHGVTLAFVVLPKLMSGG